MATGNNELNPQMHLSLFEETAAPVEPTSPVEGTPETIPAKVPLASPPATETDSSTRPDSSAQEDEVMTAEQEEDFDRLLDMGGFFTRANALGRVGVKRNVEKEPEPTPPSTRRSRSQGRRRRYTPRNDPDYQAAPWNER